MKSLVLLITLLLLSACSFLFPEDEYFLKIDPVKFIPCANPHPPNYSCGRVPVSKEQADGFVVTAGHEKYREIVGLRKGAKPSQEEQVTSFGAFVVNQLVSNGYCSSAEIPEKSRYILSWEGSGKRGIYAACLN